MRRIVDCGAAIVLLVLLCVGGLFSRRLREELAGVADGERWDEA